MTSEAIIRVSHAAGKDALEALQRRVSLENVNERAAGFTRDAGLRSLGVIADPAASGFYEALGFAMIGQAAMQFGPAYEMRLDLA
jgi:pantoate kinase